MSRPTASPVAEGVLQFLGSLGKRSEAELYLRLFREMPLGRFALLIPTAEVLEKRAGTLADQILFLQDLGLFPTVLVGSLDAVSEEIREDFLVTLEDAGVSVDVACVDDGIDVGAALKKDSVRVLFLTAPSEPRLFEVVTTLRPERTLFLRRSGGLGPHSDKLLELSSGHMLQNDKSGIGVINLRSDAEELRAAQVLSQEDELYLDRAAIILNDPVFAGTRCTVSVASPLSVIRELFTVTGEGTLIKRGSRIECHPDYTSVDQERLRDLIETSFGRRLEPAFQERQPLSLYLESDYRGLALLEPGLGAAFLTKFAVLPVARGEGLGQDLWWALSRNHPALYFRARPENPINSWYVSVCDGVHKTATWNVYWRGIEARELPAIIEDALSRPLDIQAPD